jgi:acyl carrier protein
MTETQFLETLQELLQRDEPIAVDMPLKDIAEWDSLAVMSCMAFFDKKFGIKTTFKQYKRLGSVADLIALSGGAIQ